MGRIPKDTIINNALLMKEWDFDKNDPLGFDPNKIGISSHYKVWWKCQEGHSWEAIVSNRTRHGRGCPYCSHQLPIKGETDLETCYPELAKEWHPIKNDIKPDGVMPGTHKKAWWICSLGHEWQAQIKSRTTGVGCPYCAGKKVLKGFNDLATLNPDLATEWHPTKNEELTPEEVTASSGKKVWWLCKNKHEYTASVDSRSRGTGCPICFKAMRSSFPEQAVFYYIRQVFPDAINSYRDIFKSTMELDIYIPSINTGIEYDGKVYHSNPTIRLRDSKKYQICKENGIMLVRIEEAKTNTPLLTCDHKIEIPDASDRNLNWAINNLCYYLGKIVIPDVRRDRKEILKFLEIRRTSLASEYPEIASEWDYEKNDPLVPENFAPHANERVYWVCVKCGHSWKAAIGDRTGEDRNGCPICNRKKGREKSRERIIAEKSSLAETNPELIQEWDYEKNTIEPYRVTAGSGKKVHWVCKTCGYNWEATIDHRVNGRGCPVCSNRIIIPGHNDLASQRPDLMKEWDCDNNPGLDPTHLALGSGKKAHWKCSICGNRWQATIVSRTSGHGCPACFARIRKAGLNRKKGNSGAE